MWEERHLVNSLLVRVHPVIPTLLKGCEPGAPIVLRAATALLIAKVLASIRSKKAFIHWDHVSEMYQGQNSRGPWYIPTCSAFSQLRFILDWLSGSGNGSSWPAICGVGPLEV